MTAVAAHVCSDDVWELAASKKWYKQDRVSGRDACPAAKAAAARYKFVRSGKPERDWRPRKLEPTHVCSDYEWEFAASIKWYKQDRRAGRQACPAALAAAARDKFVKYSGKEEWEWWPRKQEPAHDCGVDWLPVSHRWQQQDIRRGVPVCDAARTAASEDRKESKRIAYLNEITGNIHY